MSVTVRRATLEEVLPLRHAVLRPGRPLAASAYPYDDRAVHVGAWDGDELVGCATVYPDPYDPGDGTPGEPAAWRLRGMAVAEARRSAGIGEQVLDVATAAAAEAGAPMLWANGRSAALRFYVRLGWQAVGEEFDDASTGVPHFRIVLPLR